MTESDKQYDFPADGSDSVLLSPGMLKGADPEKLAHDAEMIRRIRAGEQIGEATVPEVVETPVVEKQPSEQPSVQKYSFGRVHGH